MDAPVATAWSVISACAFVQALLLLLYTWEHYRFVRSRLTIRRWTFQGKVAVIVPCKGLERGLTQHLEKVFGQDHSNYEIVFVVESADDPASEVIRELIAKHPSVPARIVVAGQASTSGQKVHNLLAAVEQISPDVEAIAFLDSDAQPMTSWLGHLVQRIDRPQSGSATGYRWFLPTRGSVPNWIVYSINARAAALFSPRGRHLAWGGSWAVSRSNFERLKMAENWRPMLNDDLVASGVLRQGKVRLEFEPGAVLASPLESSWSQAFEFLRRQYVQGRLYAGREWRLGLFATTLTSLALLGGLLGALVGGWPFVQAAALGYLCLLGMYAVQVRLGWYRASLVRLYLPQHEQQLRSAAAFDTWASPLVSLCNWVALLSSIGVQRLDWRGIGYEFDRDGRVLNIIRDDTSNLPVVAGRFGVEPLAPVTPEIRKAA